MHLFQQFMMSFKKASLTTYRNDVLQSFSVGPEGSPKNGSLQWRPSTVNIKMKCPDMHGIMQTGILHIQIPFQPKNSTERLKPRIHVFMFNVVPGAGGPIFDQ